MSSPFRGPKPGTYAFHCEQAQKYEERKWWLEAKEAWGKAVRVARRQDNWLMATARRDFCQRKLEQIREREQSR